MRRSRLIFVFTSLISSCVFGQIDETLNANNNIIKPKKVELIRTKYIDTTDFNIVDTIENPHGYIIQSIENKTYSIALKKRKNYILFKLADFGEIDSVSRIQLNRNKYNELIIFFNKEYNWSHADLGLASSSGFVAIYDLNKFEIIFNEKIYYYENTWGYYSDGIEYAKIKQFKYDVEFRLKTIKLKINRKLTNHYYENEASINYEYKRGKMISENTMDGE